VPEFLSDGVTECMRCGPPSPRGRHTPQNSLAKRLAGFHNRRRLLVVRRVQAEPSLVRLSKGLCVFSASFLLLLVPYPRTFFQSEDAPSVRNRCPLGGNGESPVAETAAFGECHS